MINVLLLTGQFQVALSEDPSEALADEDGLIQIPPCIERNAAAAAQACPCAGYALLSRRAAPRAVRRRRGGHGRHRP